MPIRGKPGKANPIDRATMAIVKPTASHNGITIDKYRMAWDLFFTGHTVQQIMTAVGLSRPQMEWLVRVGDANKDMPSFASRSAEISAEIRKRDVQIAELASEGAVAWIKTRKDLAVDATRLAHGLTSALAQILAPAAARAIAGTATDKDMDNMKATGPIRDALKALAPFCEFKPITDLVNSRGSYDNGVHGKAQISLNPESTMPAQVSLIEGIVGPMEASHDPLADLIPDWKEWTPEQQKRFLKDGSYPEMIDVEAKES